MTTEKSLITAYILDDAGSGKKVGWEEINAWRPEHGLLWMHLNYKAAKSKHWLMKESGLDIHTARALQIEEARPRCVINKNGLLIFLRAVNLNPGAEPEDMVSIRIWADKHRVITTRHRQVLSITDIENLIKNGHAPKSSNEFVIRLIDKINDRMGDVIEDISDQVDVLEEKVITEESHLLRPIIADVRRQAILMRRYLAPQREVLMRLQMDDIDFLNADDRVHLREATDRVINHIEELDASRDIASVVEEQLSSKIAEQIDRRMYTLSLAAVIFLPLTFITGLLGINVGGIPGSEYKFAFVIVCSILLILSVISISFFKYMKWI